MSHSLRGSGRGSDSNARQPAPAGSSPGKRTLTETLVVPGPSTAPDLRASNGHGPAGASTGAEAAEIEELLDQARALFDPAARKERRKTHRHRPDRPDRQTEDEANKWIQRYDDALAFLVFTLGSAPDAVKAGVVARLETATAPATPLLEILKLSGLDQIWVSETSTRAVCDLIALQSKTRRIADLKAILSHTVFDWGVDRWEARLAYEIVQTLPPDVQKKLMEAKGQEPPPTTGKRIERHLSAAYRASSRYDTYQGSKADPTTGDTDREKLLAQTTDPALWTPDHAGRLAQVLRMVILADEAAFVKDAVAAHYAEQSGLFAGLGFDEHGTWYEHIDDRPGASWLARVWAGIQLLAGAYSFLFADEGYRRVATIDLRDVETVLHDRLGIVPGDPVKPPRLSAPDKAEEALGYLLYSPDVGKHLPRLLGKDAVTVLDTLSKGTSGARALLAEVEGAKATAADGNPVADPETLGRTVDDRSGRDRITLGAYGVAALTRKLGHATVKLGPSGVRNFLLELDVGSVHDPHRGGKLQLDDLAITDAVIALPEQMFSIGRIHLAGLKVDVKVPDRIGATVVEQVMTDLLAAVMQIFQHVPAGAIVGLAEMARKVPAIVLTATSGIEYAELRFDSLAIDHVVDSAGDHLDSVTVGATDVVLGSDDAIGIGEMSLETIEVRLKALRGERARVAARVHRRADRGKDAGTPERKLAELDAAIQRFERGEADARKIAPLEAELTAIRDQETALAKRPDSDDRKAKLAALAARRQELEAEIAAVVRAGVRVDGTIGAIEARGVAWSGATVEHARTSDIHLSAEVDDGSGTPQGGGARIDTVMVEKASYTGAPRKDVAIRAQIAEIEAARKQGRAPASADRTLAELRAELAVLEPRVAEYELLRARLTDKQRPMTAEEKTRFAALQAELHGPPDVAVDKLEARGVTADATATGQPGKPPALGAALHADEVNITGVTSTDTATGARTTVAKISATDADVRLPDAGADVVDVKAGTVAIEKLTAEGAADVRKDQAAGNAAATTEVAGAIADLDAQIAAARARTPPDEAAIKDCEARRRALAQERDQLAIQAAGLAAAGSQASARADLIAAVDAALPSLVGSDGVDRSRGFSLGAAVDGARSAKQLADDLFAGKTDSDPTEVCVANAGLRIAEYEAAMAAWDREHDTARKAYEAAKAALGKARTADDKLAAEGPMKLARAEMQRLHDLIEAAREQKLLWQGRLTTLDRRIKDATARQAEMDRLAKVYRGLIAVAARTDILAGAPAARLDDRSAFAMRQAAAAAGDSEATTTVDTVTASGVDAKITGAGVRGDGQGPLTIRGGGKDGKLVDDITIGGVTAGGNRVAEIHLKDLGARAIEVNQPGLYQIDGLGLGRLALGPIAWQGAGYGVKVEGSTELDGVEVDATIDTRGHDMAGMIYRFRAGTLTGDRVTLQYEDYVFTLGKLTAGGAGLAGVEVSDYDLASGAFDDLTLRGTDAAGLKADLGAGFTIGARTLSAARIDVKALVTEAGRTQAAADGKPPEMNRVTTEIDQLSGEGIAAAMKADGIDVQVAQVKNASVRGLTVDFATGDFELAGFAAPALHLGPVTYADPGKVLTTTIGEGQLTGVRLSGKGKLGFDDKKDAADRKAGKVPPFIQALRFDDIHADTAVLDHLHLVYDTPDKKTSADAAEVWARDLDIRGYDFVTSAMTIQTGDAGVDGLAIGLSDALGATSTWGSYTVGGLRATLDDHGGIDADIVRAMSGVGPDGKPLATAVSSQPRRGAASGATATLGETSGHVSSSGGTTAFTGVTCEALSLDRIDWSSGVDSIVGDQPVKVDGISLNGTVTSTYEQVVVDGSPQGFAYLPKTTVQLDSLVVDRIAAPGGLTLRRPGGATPIPTTVVTDVRVTGLSSSDGKIARGKFDIGQVDTAIAAGQEAIARQLHLSVGSKLSASGIHAAIDGADTRGSVDALEVVSAVAELPLDGSTRARAVIPHARISDLKAFTHEEVERDAQVGAGAYHVGKVELLDDANLFVPIPRTRAGAAAPAKPPVAAKDEPDLVALTRGLNGAITSHLVFEGTEPGFTIHATATLPMKDGVVRGARLDSAGASFAPLNLALEHFGEFSLEWYAQLQMWKDEGISLDPAIPPATWWTRFKDWIYEGLETAITDDIDDYWTAIHLMDVAGKLAVGPFARPIDLGRFGALKLDHPVALDFAAESSPAPSGPFDLVKPPKARAHLGLEDLQITRSRSAGGQEETTWLGVGGVDLATELKDLQPMATIVSVGPDGVVAPGRPDSIHLKILKGSSLTHLEMLESHAYTRKP